MYITILHLSENRVHLLVHSSMSDMYKHMFKHCSECEGFTVSICDHQSCIQRRITGIVEGYDETVTLFNYSELQLVAPIMAELTTDTVMSQN